MFRCLPAVVLSPTPTNDSSSRRALCPSDSGRDATSCPPCPTASARPAPFSRALVARAVAFLMLLLTGLVVDPGAVRAQSAIQPTVVLDFGVETGADPITGRKAADALAVELQRSGDFEVVTRQQVEEAVRSQPGLRPPYNEPTQARLAGAVGARSVFSGRIVRSIITSRSARVQIEVRQLEAGTGDYVNGTQISEVTEDKLADTDPDTLLDEALNKAAFAAVRAMKQTRLPEGTVLNVARDDIQINLGSRNGVVPGQRYSVLRDVFNKPRNIVERVKIGEVTITVIEADQSTAVLSAGGQNGVTTRDKVRQIFIPGIVSPISANSTGTSTPVTAPPARQRRKGGFVHKTSQSLLAIGGLLALVAFAGLGGGSQNGATTTPKNISAVPIPSVADSATGFSTAAIRVKYSAGLPIVVAGQDVIGYLVFRSTSPNFTASVETLADFVSGNQTTYVDSSLNGGGRKIVITGGATTNGVSIVETDAPITAGVQIGQANNVVTIIVQRDPLVPGVQYFYRVTRITGTRTAGGTTAAPVINISPVLSNPSGVSGGATALPTLTLTNGGVDDTGVAFSGNTSNNLDAFTVTLPGGLVRGEIDRITVQVSTDSRFPTNSTFIQVFSNPGRDSVGNVVLNLGDIIVPGFSAGDTNVFVRVGLSNSTDSPGATIFSRPLQLVNPTGANSIASRFLSADGIGRRRGGLGLPGGGSGNGKFGPRRGTGYILRPH